MILLFLLTFSCKPSSEKQDKKPHKQETIQPIPEKKFFDYTTIDYYKTTLNEFEALHLFDKQLKTKLDSIQFGVLLGAIPSTISDTAFIAKLPQLGYEKSIVKTTKFDRIDAIFKEKKSTESIETACVEVYRHLLVFRKNNKVVGIAKICFGCRANQIKGTQANTENFGQDGDYEALQKILEE